MKFKLLIIVVLIISGAIMTSAQSIIQWEKSLGGTDDEIAYSVQSISQGYLIAGKTYSNDGDVHGSHGWLDFWIVKLNSYGDTIWEKSLGGSMYEEAHCIRQTSDQGYIIAGFSNSSDGQVTGNHGGNDYWVVKIDQNGNILWQKSFGGTDDDEAYSIEQTTDGGYIVAGYSNSTDGDVTGNHGDFDYWVVKLNASGILQWEKSFGGTSYDEAASIQQTADTGYILNGVSFSTDGQVTGNHGNEDYWVVKLDKTGNIQWEKSLGGGGEDYGTDVKQTSDHGYIVAGYAASNDQQVSGNHGGDDFWIVKLDQSGSIQWENSYGGSYDEIANSIIIASDNNYVIAGYTSSSDGNVTANQGGEDYWVVMINTSGSILWQKTYGGTDFDEAYSIRQDIDGSFIVAGESNSTDGDVTGNHGGDDFWIVKLTVPSGINYLQQSDGWKIYPNPTEDHLILESDSTVNELCLYNTFGGKLPITINSDGKLTSIRTSQLSNGIYYLSFSINRNRFTQKVMISK